MLKTSVRLILTPFSRAVERVANPRKAEQRRRMVALRQAVTRSGLFDPRWYAETNFDVSSSRTDPLHHFLHHGMPERRDPGPGFQTDYYCAHYPDWSDGFATPFEHYLAVGRARAYQTRFASPYQRWLAQFDALTPDDLARIAADAAAAPLPVPTVIFTSDRGELAAREADLAAQVGIRCGPVLVATAAGLRPLGDRASDAPVRLPAGPVVLLSPEVRLRPHAAWALLRALERLQADAVYADHDAVDEAGERSAPVFKPAMSPLFLRSLDYVGPVAAFRSPPADPAALGGEAAIRRRLLALDPARVGRVPFILYGLAGAPPVAGPWPEPAAPAPADLPSVDIIVPTRDRVGLLRECLESIRTGTDYPADRYRVLVVDNDSRDPETLDYFDTLRASGAAAVVPSPGPFNFSRINNEAVAASSATVVLFLNNDTTVLRPDWLRALVRHAAEPGTGAVGCKLLYPDGTIQHGGVALGVQGVAAHYLVGRRPEEAGPFDVTREMTSLTGACLAVRREAFDAVGGFDEALEVAFNDVSLCAKLAGAGYRNVYVADALLIHHESKSRGFDDTPAKIRKQSREAIYARTRFAALFADDPTYSPNKSLVRIDDLGVPPRVVRPWRRVPGARTILILSRTHQLGHGVAVVLAEQARFFRDRGWRVVVGGPATPHDLAYPGCERVVLVTEAEAAAYAVANAVDCVVAHTPPFFSCTRVLGPTVPVYFVDHGEPKPDFFPEGRAEREGLDWEKRFAAPLARRVFAISQTIWGQQFRPDAIVLRNGNSHLAVWSENRGPAREAARLRLGLSGRFTVLNVCRFAEDTRRYKGVDLYAQVANEFPFLFPDLKDRVAFLIAGRGDPEDVAFLEGEGLRVHPNVTDDQLLDLYGAADLYMNFSKWEGYNLGIGQALAMGLPVIASNIEAHREFPVHLSDDVLPICLRLAEHVRGDRRPERTAFVEPWEDPLGCMEATIAQDVEDGKARWI